MRFAFGELHRFRIYHLIAATPAALPSQTAARQIITESAAFSTAARYLPFSINFKLSSENVENVVKPPQKPVCRQFSRCEGCPYPAHGFLCWGSGDDCMRTRVEKLNREEKAKYENQSGAL